VVLFGRRVPLAAALLPWCLVWELAGRLDLSPILPPLSRILLAGATLVGSEQFRAAAGLSLRSFASGMGLAVLVGLPLGLGMARAATLRRLLGPPVQVFVSAPISALVPLLMGVVGIGERTVAVTVFLFAVFVIILDTEVGVRTADRSLVEMARAFGARPLQLYTRVLLWSALPEILSGLRLAAIRGVKGVVIGQLLVAILGVGALFELYSKHFLMEEFWALVLLVFLFAFLVSEAIAFLERRVEYYAGVR